MRSQRWMVYIRHDPTIPVTTNRIISLRKSARLYRIADSLNTRLPDREEIHPAQLVDTLGFVMQHPNAFDLPKNNLAGEDYFRLWRLCKKTAHLRPDCWWRLAPMSSLNSPNLQSPDGCLALGRRVCCAHPISFLYKPVSIRMTEDLLV